MNERQVVEVAVPVAAAGHVARALAVYLRRLQGDGRPVPADLETLFETFRDVGRQSATDRVGGVAGPAVGVDGGAVGSLLTVDETARLLGVSGRTVHRMLTAGDLTRIRVGRSVRVARGELEELVARQLRRDHP